jgi:hypothetical protein
LTKLSKHPLVGEVTYQQSYPDSAASTLLTFLGIC